MAYNPIPGVGDASWNWEGKSPTKGGSENWRQTGESRTGPRGNTKYKWEFTGPEVPGFEFPEFPELPPAPPPPPAAPTRTSLDVIQEQDFAADRARRRRGFLSTILSPFSGSGTTGSTGLSTPSTPLG